MIIECGPLDDRRTLSLTLPEEKKRLAMFISGGIDSAILYYLMLEENKKLNNLHEITPFSIIRKEGSRYFANLVIAHIHSFYGIPYREPIIVGDNTLPEHKQVKSGAYDARELGYDIVYLGLIEQLPQHMVGWFPIPYKESDRFKAPLHLLNKSHIIDLIVQLKQESLFYITHSCSSQEIGRCNRCNGCNERSWGFTQLDITDPSII
jgi:Queuosine biosynthesis protein QueC